MICRAYACSRKLQKRLLGTVKFLSECIHKTMSVKLASRLNQLWSSMVSSHSIFEKNGLYCYADNRNDLFVGRRHNGEGGQGGGGRSTAARSSVGGPRPPPVVRHYAARSRVPYSLCAEIAAESFSSGRAWAPFMTFVAMQAPAHPRSGSRQDRLPRRRRSTLQWPQMQAETARRHLAGALRTSTCCCMQMAWPGESSKSPQRRGLDTNIIMQFPVTATGHAWHAKLASSSLQDFQPTHAPVRRAAAGDMLS